MISLPRRRRNIKVARMLSAMLNSRRLLRSWRMKRREMTSRRTHRRLQHSLGIILIGQGTRAIRQLIVRRRRRQYLNLMRLMMAARLTVGISKRLNAHFDADGTRMSWDVTDKELSVSR